MRVSKFDRRICRFLLDGTQLLVVLTVATASFGSIAPAYAEDATVNVTYGVAA